MITIVQIKLDQEGRRAMKLHRLYLIFAFLNAVISMSSKMSEIRCYDLSSTQNNILITIWAFLLDSFLGKLCRNIFFGCLFKRTYIQCIAFGLWHYSNIVDYFILYILSILIQFLVRYRIIVVKYYTFNKNCILFIKCFQK